MIEPEIVNGAPGAGKTTHLLNEVERELAAGVEPERIGYVSFTRRAATEAAERAAARFGFETKRLPHFRTIHSICFRGLGLKGTDVFEGDRVTEFGDWIGYQTRPGRWSEEGLTTGFLPAERALFMENLARVREIPLRQQYEEDHDDLPWSFVDRIARGLAQFKRDRQLLDYTDMLREFVETGDSPELEVLFVDEAQDLAMAQWRVVEKLARGARRLVVAGDDDQSIYRWSGAAVDHFVDMPGRVTVLGQSWRCPRVVQELATSIIGRVGHRRPKTWNSRDSEGELTRVRTIGDADLEGDSVLILARNVFLLDDLREKLRDDGVIYEYHDRPSVSGKILETVQLWERIRRHEKVTVDQVRQVYEYMTSGIGVRRGYKTLPGWRDDELVDVDYLVQAGGLMTEAIWHEALTRIPDDERGYMLRALRRGEKLTRRPRVRVSTIHGAKGAEADHVVLMTDVAARTWREYEKYPDDEARVFYVGVTRARERLTVVAPQTNLHYDV